MGKYETSKVQPEKLTTQSLFVISDNTFGRFCLAGFVLHFEDTGFIFDRPDLSVSAQLVSRNIEKPPDCL